MGGAGLLPWVEVGPVVAAILAITALLYNHFWKEQTTSPRAKVREKIKERIIEREREEEDVLVDESTEITEEDYVYYNLSLGNGDNLQASVAANGQINVFVLTKYAFSKFEKEEDFSYEAGSEEVSRTVLHFVTDRDGKWVFVVQNAGEREVSVDIRVTRG